MNSERYPKDLVITEQDFHESGWKKVLESATREGYSSMRQSFSYAARQAMDYGGLPTHCKVLWLLADSCSMTLSPVSVSDHRYSAIS